MAAGMGTKKQCRKFAESSPLTVPATAPALADPASANVSKGKGKESPTGPMSLAPATVPAVTVAAVTFEDAARFAAAAVPLAGTSGKGFRLSAGGDEELG